MLMQKKFNKNNYDNNYQQQSQQEQSQEQQSSSQSFLQQQQQLQSESQSSERSQQQQQQQQQESPQQQNSAPPSPPPPRPPEQQRQRQQEEEKSSSSSLLLWKDALAGCVAGVISRTIMAPIERIKLIVQLQHSSSTSTLSSFNSNNNNNNNPNSTRSSSTKLFFSHPSVVVTSPYRTALDVYYNEGILSFWRGNLPNVIRVSGTAAINFVCLEQYKEFVTRTITTTTGGDRVELPTAALRNNNNNDNVNNNDNIDNNNSTRIRSMMISFISGGLAGATSTTILYPVEFIRTRLAVDRGIDIIQHHHHNNNNNMNNKKNNNNSKPQHKHKHKQRSFRGSMDVIRTIVSTTDGILGLYRGYMIALIGNVVFRILYLGGYDAMKNEMIYYKKTKTKLQQQQIQQIQQKPQQSLSLLSWSERFLIAQTVSLIAGTIAYPFDTVRRRMMMTVNTTTSTTATSTSTNQNGQQQQQQQQPTTTITTTSSSSSSRNTCTSSSMNHNNTNTTNMTRNHPPHRYINNTTTNYGGGAIYYIKHIYLNEGGIRGFYLGLGPNMIRSIGSAMLLVLYDITKNTI